MQSDFFSLALDGMSPTDFLERYWEKQFIYIDRSGNREIYGPYYDPRAPERYLSHRSLCDPDIRIFKDGIAVPFNEYSREEPLPRLTRRLAETTKMVKLYRAGATLIFQHVQRSDQQAMRIVRSVENALGIQAGAHVYLTPPGGRGFVKHWDHGCAFILQIRGSKVWEIFERALIPDPMLGPHPPQKESAEPERTITLYPGDLLYIPKGVPHAPRATDQMSVHINIPLNPIRYHDALRSCLDDFVRQVEDSRVGIRPAHMPLIPSIVERFAQHMGSYDFTRAVQDLEIRKILESRPADVQLDPPAALERSPDDINMIEPNAGARWDYRLEADSLRVYCSDCVQTLPTSAEPVVKAVQGLRAPARAATVFDTLDPSAAGVLRRLAEMEIVKLT